MTRRITQDDVAKAAGVSRFTVSCVVNNLSGGNVRVSDETRQRVLQVVEQLGYVPNRMARSLRTSKTNTIACIIPDISNPFYPLFARGIQDVAVAHQYNLFLMSTDGIVDRERNSLRAAIANQVDGIIYSQFNLTEEDLLTAKVPVVINGHMSVNQFDRLMVDDRKPSYEMISLLIESGHSRIAIIAGQKESPQSQARLEGYRQALVDHNIPENSEWIRFGDFSERGGKQEMHNLLMLTKLPTAIFAANDLIALGAMMEIRDAGFRIPDDFSLVGFDNIPTVSYTTPALTTVNQFQYNIGQKAAEMLFERIEGLIPSKPRYVEMPYEIIIRESVAPPSG
ncbi:MAG: LacI family DNA-binding transcriptional regulator [Anaerolineaceae bacterium]|nr:LacI family DNA-binding transcriptional regulator [Anaerolineaceae bacterium]